ncbi:hypothetical protein SM033_00108 [Vibrio phage vB_VpaM_sm033]|nr:hypothetical protein SM033_00108 [Vibrio phage vB_VpaM_sm033]
MQVKRFVLTGFDKTAKLDMPLSSVLKTRSVYQTLKSTAFMGHVEISIDKLVKWTTAQMNEYPKDTRLSLVCMCRFLGELPDSLDDFALLPTDQARALSRVSKKQGDALMFTFQTESGRWRMTAGGAAWGMYESEAEAHDAGLADFNRRITEEFLPVAGESASKQLKEIRDWVIYHRINKMAWQPQGVNVINLTRSYA